eukprot:jgi/Botrbrau1/10263/Bobra.0140s0017.1
MRPGDYKGRGSSPLPSGPGNHGVLATQKACAHPDLCQHCLSEVANLRCCANSICVAAQVHQRQVSGCFRGRGCRIPLSGCISDPGHRPPGESVWSNRGCLGVSGGVWLPGGCSLQCKGHIPGGPPAIHRNVLGVVSWPFCQQVVESSQALLQIGTVWNDYSSVAYTNLISSAKSVRVDDHRITVGEKITFGRVQMLDFVRALTKKIKKNKSALELHARIYDPPGMLKSTNPDALLSIKHLFHHVQDFLTGNDHIVVDTGDSWFNALRLRLPKGCGFDIQMQFGSIGWSVPAALGVAAAARHRGRRIINIVGDGAFQMTAQEVATSVKAGLNVIILLINNGCYTIEEELHKGPYNFIPIWDYAAFARAVAGPKPIFTAKIKTESELLAAFKAVRTEHEDKVCLLEAFTDPQDCSYEILEWGARLANYTGRAPNPQ